MTPLPASLGGGELVAWRLDQTAYAATWDNGEGARLAGGRWNSRGRRVVYCALDPATAILEVAVHVSFKTLDTVRYSLTSVTIIDPSTVHVVQPNAVPNPRSVALNLDVSTKQTTAERIRRCSSAVGSLSSPIKEF